MPDVSRSSRPPLLRLVGGLFLLALAAGTVWIFISTLRGATSLLPDEQNAPSIFGNPLTAGSLQQEEGRTNTLVLGISGAEHISGELTDSIMLASVHHEQGTADLVSIPRDLWVQTPEGHMKINELYRIGGGSQEPDAGVADLIAQRVEEITGQPVHYVAVVDLDAIGSVVQSLGSITIDGQSYDADTITTYVRDRSTAGGDFDRMRRQQKTLVALLDALRSSSPQQLLQTYAVLAEHVSVSASIPELLAFSQLGRAITPENVSFHVITPLTDNLLREVQRPVEGRTLYTLEPTAGLDNYSAIVEYVETILSEENL